MNVKRIGPAMGASSRPSKLQQLYVSAADSIHRRNKISTATDLSRAGDDREVVIVCVSDTHNLKPDLPNGDILIHAGDLSEKGTFDELQAQLNWLQSQPHAHKIVVAGNHDLLLDTEFCLQFPHRDPSGPGKSRGDLNWGSIQYLQNSQCRIDVKGRVFKLWGSPLTPQFGNWAFQYPPIRDVWSDVVPAGTDIIITHGPPKLYLDDNGKGDENLLRELRRVKPQLSVFGHIHPGNGQYELLHEPRSVQNLWEEVKLHHGGILALAGMLSRSVIPIAGDSVAQSTIVVNAAIKQRGEPAMPRVIYL